MTASVRELGMINPIDVSVLGHIVSSSSWAGTEARANAGEDGFDATAGSSKSDYAYTRIREAIVAGKFGPGYRLVISTLARDLGCPPNRCVRRFGASRPEAGSSTNAIQLNRASHEVLLERCGNRMLVLTVRDTWDRLDNMQRSHGFYGGVAQESVAEHRELLTLLENEPEHEPIERFCRDHLLRVVDAYVASSDRVGLSSGGRG